MNNISPRISGLLVEYTEKQENKGTLKRIKDGEEYLECFPEPTNRDNGKNGKEPSETEEKHDSAESDDYFDDFSGSYFVISLDGLASDAITTMTQTNTALHSTVQG